MESIPIYNALIKDSFDGITAISLVDAGAVEIDFQMFAKEIDEDVQFSIQNEDEHLLLGCVMRADYNIIRRKDDFKYFVRYSRETIEKMATKMMADGTFANIRMQHQGQNLPKGAIELRELFIKDSTKGISPKGFEACAEGSLFAVYKVNAEPIWELCKQGVFNSFSLEGMFKWEEAEFSKINDNKNITIMSKIKQFMTKLLEEFSSVKDVNGVEIFFDGEEIAVGVEVADADGNAIADGEYVVEDKVIVVKDGVVEEIKDKEEEEVVEEEEPKTEEVEAEEEPTEEPATEPTEPAKEVPDYEAEIAALKAEIEALKSEVEAIKAQLSEPAAEPIAEEFSKVTEAGKTGVKNVDKAISILSALKE